MALWRETLFVFMLGNAAQAPGLFRIPSDQVVELRMTLEIQIAWRQAVNRYELPS